MFAGLIAHRGNVWGPQPAKENFPSYIDCALNQGFDAEIDLWVVDGLPYLGHDFGDYLVSDMWLGARSTNLWIHCKNLHALTFCSQNRKLNYFWHQGDDYTLTSKGYVWTYPGKPVPFAGVMVDKNLKSCQGGWEWERLCSDWVGEVKKNG